MIINDSGDHIILIGDPFGSRLDKLTFQPVSSSRKTNIEIFIKDETNSVHFLIMHELPPIPAGGIGYYHFYDKQLPPFWRVSVKLGIVDCEFNVQCKYSCLLDD